MRVLTYDPATNTTQFGGDELIRRWEPGSREWLWIDLDAEERDYENHILIDRFNLDPLAVADVQRDRHPPKLEVFDDHLVLLLKGLSAESEDIEFETIQIGFFLGENFLISRRDEISPSIERIWSEAEAGTLSTDRGPAHVLYRICRTIADRYAPIVLALEGRLETLEGEMFRQPRDELLAELLGYVANLRKLRRVFAYQQTLMAELMQGDSRYIGERGEHEFRDAFEQMERLASLSQLYQELAVDLMNGHISLTSHRLNQIMKVLTIVTVIFLPLGILAGIYGMNFDYMPELDWRYGYFAALGTMGTVVVTLLTIFRRKGWL
ncbi:magnesium/cobalt transporter CorA [Lentisalinibacter sediminis]|uniref:magnesium/cobalt transporter CorA n=1 Tax=Lentisalinibacter sediminis TaxID=2992237 RepID=UPI003864D9CA